MTMSSLDSTQIQTYCYCPRLYRNKFILNLRKIETEAVDLEFGRLVHKALETYYKCPSLDTSFIPTIWQEFVDKPTDTYKTKTNGIKLCTDYINHYNKLDLGWEILAIEKPLLFNIGKDLEYIVKVDAVIKVNGNIFSLEHKTTKEIRQGYFSRYSPNLQISAQTAAVTHHFGQCSGVLVNVLGMKDVKKPVLLAPDQAEVKDYPNVEVKYCKYYSQEMAYCTGLVTEFRREIVNRTVEQVKDFEINALAWARKIKASHLTNIYPKNEGYCHQWDTGTNRKQCEFCEMCLSVDEEAIRENLYEKYDAKEYLNENRT